MVDDITAPTPPKRRRRKAPPLLLPFDDAVPGEAPATATAHATPDDQGPAHSDAPLPQAATAAVAAAEPTEGAELPTSLADAPEDAPAAPPPIRRRKRAAAVPVVADTSPEPEAKDEDKEGKADAAASAPAADLENEVGPGEPATETTIPGDTFVTAASPDATAQDMANVDAEPAAAVREPSGVDKEGPTAHAPAQEPQPAEPAVEAAPVRGDDSVAMESVPDAVPADVMADDAATGLVQAEATVAPELTKGQAEVSPPSAATGTEGDDAPVEGPDEKAPDVAPPIPDIAPTVEPSPAPATMSAAMPPAQGPRPAKGAARPVARSRKGLRIGAVEIGAGQVGALALGALAIGALAIGALAIGRLAVGRAHVRRLEVDELVIGTVKDKPRRR